MDSTASAHSNALSPCVLYGKEEDAAAPKEALLGNKAQNDRRQTLQGVRANAFGLGMTIGVLVPFAILSAHAFYFLQDGGKSMEAGVTTEYVVASVVLSSIPMTVFPIVVLNLLQSLVHVAFYGNSATVEASDDLAQRVMEEELDDVLEQMETRFLGGTVVGLLVSWSIEELALGYQSRSIFSLSIFALATLCSGSAVYYCKNLRGSSSSSVAETPVHV